MMDQVIKLFHAKVYMHLRTCLVIGLILIGYTLSAQKVIRNSAGEKIIQYEDGTWRYFEGRDSMLESDLWEDISKITEIESDSLPQDQPIVYDYRLFQKYIAAAVKYESEMLDKVDASSIRAHTLEDQILSFESINDTSNANRVKAEFELLTEQRQNEQRRLSYARSLIKKILKVGKSERYAKLAKIYVPGLNTDVEPGEQETLLANEHGSDLEKNRKSRKVLSSNQEDQKMEIDQNEDSAAISNLQMSGDSVIADSVSSDISETISYTQTEPGPNIRSEEIKLDSLTTAPEKLISNPEEEAKTTDSIAEVVTQEVDPDTNMITDLVAQPIDDAVDFETRPSDENTLEQKQKESALPKKEIALTRYSAADGNHWFSSLQSKSPKYQCEFSFHGIDEFTRTQKKELKDELFFSHTDERLKPYLKDQDYMSCRGYLTSISGGFRYLTLIFSIASKNANREYGYIKNGSLLNIKLLDGETVSLFTQSENQGTLDPKSGYTIYKVRYPIDYQKEKLLLKSGIDKVRVVWSSGYEDYEVYNIDFFTNQLGCLNSK